MYRGSIKRLILTALVLTVSLLAVCAAPRWEKIDPLTVETSDTADSPPFEVKVYDGAIVLTLSSKSPVKVITILGQPVTQQELEAGSWRLQIPARGIYILKIGSATRRITL